MNRIESYEFEDAFWADGEWVSWDDIPDLEPERFCSSHLARLEYEAELRRLYPLADIRLIPYFKALLDLARSHYGEFGRHLQIYGEIGELFGAIAYGIRRNRPRAQGSDGRLGRDHVEIKTISPEKTKAEVTVKFDATRNFNKLLIVRIDDRFDIEGRLIDRREALAIARRGGKVPWDVPVDRDGT